MKGGGGVGKELTSEQVEARMYDLSPRALASFDRKPRAQQREILDGWARAHREAEEHEEARKRRRNSQKKTDAAREATERASRAGYDLMGRVRDLGIAQSGEHSGMFRRVQRSGHYGMNADRRHEGDEEIMFVGHSPGFMKSLTGSGQATCVEVRRSGGDIHVHVLRTATKHLAPFELYYVAVDPERINEQAQDLFIRVITFFAAQG